MESSLLKALGRLKKELPRRFKELREKCDSTIDVIDKGDFGEDVSNEDAAALLDFFSSCALTRQPRVMEIALEAINFMIDHGYFRGNHSINGTTTLMDSVIEVVSKCGDEFEDGVQLQVIKALLTSITSLQCEVHGASLLLAVRTCFHIHLMTKNVAIKTTAKAALTQMVNVVNQRMEVHDIHSRSDSTTEVETTAPVANDESKDDQVDMNMLGTNSFDLFTTVYQKDAYLLFRALCKLSMKGVNDEILSQGDGILIQNKMLSLELLLILLQNCGPTFKKSEKFISAVRSYLCVSLLSNITSQVAQVTGLSLQIFVLLTQHFKMHLKSELEVFVSTIFFRILDSENSSLDHKIRVLEVFHDICRNPKDLIELFLNYDCDMDAANLFSNIVSAFAKVAKNPSFQQSRISVEFISGSAKRYQSEDVALRCLGAEGLLLIAKSLLASVDTVRSGTEDFAVDHDSRRDASVADKSFEPADEQLVHAVDDTSANSNIVETFDKKVKIQEAIDNGILQFNLHPMRGIRFLCSAGHLQMTPKSVADFLHLYQDKLDKAAIGDLLGREREYENGFAYAVLNEYVEGMDFAEMKFDKAIRYFLHGFRLPGEAQKIDRIMEKFAERYFIQHTDEFASADMAFILAFSTIMLQTNLHNPAIRDDKRMTKEQFIRQNKGISSDGELSDELLSEIYDRIAAEPISITQDNRKQKREEVASSFVVFQSATDKRKKDAFNSERLEMVRAGEAMIRQGKKRGSVFVQQNSSSEESYVRPMFEVLWAPVIGVVSQILETSDDSKLVELSLSCLQTSISLSCRLDQAVARKTMMHVLAKFTTLDVVKEMKTKNVQCIRLLLEIALTEGEYLEDSWMPVLQQCSQLARLLLLSSGGQTDEIFFSNAGIGRKPIRMGSQDRMMSSQSDSLTKLFLGPSRAEINRSIEETNSELISRDIDASAVDRIFLSSKNLSAAGVLQFVRSLCEVSHSEISLSSAMNSLKGKDCGFDSAAPRIFSLQKLVEVADYNMISRSRVEWSNIWKYLADHFTNVGLQENQALAMYAIDSLKQLSIKFLQKNELSNFNFQRLFLRPFEIIISKSTCAETRDLVLRCIDIMIKTSASNIRSGWKSIFSILDVSAHQQESDIAKFGFEILDGLMVNQFSLLTHDFVELMNTLVAFVSSRHTELSLRALNNLSRCAEQLALGLVVPVSKGNEEGSDRKFKIEEDAAVFRLWWPLLLGLSTHVADHRIPVRFQALDTLSLVLNKYGDIFSPQTWSVIFKGILFPMIDSAKMESSSSRSSSLAFKQSWISTMASSVLSTCLDLFFRFDTNAAEAPLLPALLTMLQGCICQDNDALARMGLETLSRLMLSDLIALPDERLELIVRHIEKLLSGLLVFDFADAGSLTFSELPCLHLYPTLVLMKSQHSSVDTIRYGPFGEAKLSRSGRVETIFGPGVFSEVLTEDLIGTRERWKIDLDWGAKLFCADVSAIMVQPKIEKRSMDWSLFAPFLSTSFFITVEFLRVVSEFSTKVVHRLPFMLSIRLTNAVEVSYWHALEFNEHMALRLRLKSLGVDVKRINSDSTLPQLIDQEATSAKIVLQMLFELYLLSSENSKSSMVMHNLERISIQLTTKFIQLEQKLGLFENNLVSDCNGEMRDEDDDSDNSFMEHALDETAGKNTQSYRHAAYVPVVVFLLKQLLLFSDIQYLNNQKWMINCMTKLIVCDNLQIRILVASCFHKFVEKRLL